MLRTLLDEKKCFKLICGAGNENLAEVEKLVALYASAGCHFFDLSASEEVLKAAQRGLDFAIPKNGQNGEQKDYHFCVSVGMKNDPHICKARINSEKCKRCEKCVKICPRHAISEYFKVREKDCIGCQRCKSVCKHGAIEIYSKEEAFDFSAFQSYNISCIELHASGEDKHQVEDIWDSLCKNFDGMLSLCIDRSKLSNEQIIKRIKRLIEKRAPYSTIIQADGAPMSGGEDDCKTTLQAVAMAEIIQDANLPVYVLLSGGTNSKTAELANLCGVDFNGIGVGSFARKIVKQYIERDDFLTNQEIFEEALKIVKNLIKSAQIIQ